MNTKYMNIYTERDYLFWSQRALSNSPPLTLNRSFLSKVFLVILYSFWRNSRFRSLNYGVNLGKKHSQNLNQREEMFNQKGGGGNGLYIYIYIYRHV